MAKASIAPGRYTVRYVMKSEAELYSLVEEARIVWGSAETLRRTPTWNGQPSETAFVEDFRREENPLIDDLLLDLARDESLMVSAYALLALHRRLSPVIADVSPDILKREGFITIDEGMFLSTRSYQDFATEMRQHGRIFKKGRRFSSNTTFLQ